MRWPWQKSKAQLAMEALAKATVKAGERMDAEPDPRPPTGDDWNDLYNTVLFWAEKAGVNVRGMYEPERRS